MDPLLPSAHEPVPAGSGRLPPWTRWAFGFQFLNAINFTLALGTPMVLCARFLGARESLIGFLLSLTPFMMALQLFSSNTAERWGYKRLMLAGWGTRSFLVLLCAPLPLLAGRASAWLLLGGLTVNLLVFSLIRGFTAGTWVPWLNGMLPGALRGRYLGREMSLVSLGVLVTALASGLLLGRTAEGWKYSVLFVCSWLAGMASVTFLRNMPFNRPAGQAKAWRNRRQLRDAYRAVWAHAPFRRMSRYAALHAFALTAVPGFLVIFLRDHLHLGDGAIMVQTSAATAGAIGVGLWVGRAADRFGSRPLMRVATLAQMAMMVVWTLVAANVYRPGPAAVAVLYVSSGVIGSLHAVPLGRLLMAFCPRAEMTIAIGLHAMIVSICGGLGPLLWGQALQVLHAHGAQDWPVPPFVIFFGAVLFLGVIGQGLLSRIPEREAVSTRHLIVALVRQSPLNVLTYLNWANPRARPRKPDGRA